MTVHLLLLPYEDPQAAHAAILSAHRAQQHTAAFDPDKHPRGGDATNRGEFSKAPGSGSAKDRAKARWSGGKAAVHAIVKDQGFTFKSHVGDGPTSGYMCSTTRGAEESFPIADLTPEHIAAYRDKHAAELAKPDNYLGGWVWEGKVYLDVSTHFKDRASALKAAKEHDQIGIYDIGTGQTVETAKELGTGRVASTMMFSAASSDLNVVNALRASIGLPPLLHNTTTAISRAALRITSKDS